MINDELLNTLRGMKLQDIFDTLKPFWKEALNWERQVDEGHVKTKKSPCGKLLKSFIPCPECGEETELENVCPQSPFYAKGYRTMIMCKSEECFYYEYLEKKIIELTQEMQEVHNG